MNRHFDTKEDLLTAVLEFWRAETDTLIDPETTGLEFFAELEALIGYHVKHRGFLELFLTLGTEASDPSHPAAAFMRERYRSILAEFIGHLEVAVSQQQVRAMDTNEIGHECRALIAYMDGIELQWLLDPTLNLVGQFGRYLQRTIQSWALITR